MCHPTFVLQVSLGKHPRFPYASTLLLKRFQIYWVGPILGALLATGFYKFIKMLVYQTANPVQDADRHESQEIFQARSREETHSEV